MRRTKEPEDLENNILDEFKIPQAKSKKCLVCSKGILKCCSVLALSLALNAFSFYVGYKVAIYDLDNSDNEFVSVAVDVMSKEGWNLALEHGETINGADYQALNISKDFGKVNLLAHLGSEESVIGLAYNF